MLAEIHQAGISMRLIVQYNLSHIDHIMSQYNVLLNTYKLFLLYRLSSLKYSLNFDWWTGESVEDFLKNFMTASVFECVKIVLKNELIESVDFIHMVSAAPMTFLNAFGDDEVTLASKSVDLKELPSTSLKSPIDLLGVEWCGTWRKPSCILIVSALDFLES